MGNEYQALTVHSKKRRRDNHHHQGKNSQQKDNSGRLNKDLYKLRCYTCDERGHFARNCPMKKKNYKRRHHAHTAKDDDPPKKRVKQENEDSSSDEEYVLISALTRTITHGSKDWLIDSGVSKNMTGLKDLLRNYPNIIHPIR